MRLLAHRKKLTQKEKWPLVIWFDDREKKGRWKIHHPKFKFVRKRLPVADYTIKGYEDIIAVEKKSGFAELIGNITGKKRAKFEQYLQKLAQYALPVLVVEENLGKVPRVLRSLGYSQLRPENVYNLVNRIIIEYGITLVCMDCKGLEKDVFLYHLFEQLQFKAEIIRKGIT